ncbi:hypothetical protein BJY59DRAFT_700050, partial [Rhodotorula toruloides]
MRKNATFASRLRLERCTPSHHLSLSFLPFPFRDNRSRLTRAVAKRRTSARCAWSLGRLSKLSTSASSRPPLRSHPPIPMPTKTPSRRISSTPGSSGYKSCRSADREHGIRGSCVPNRLRRLYQTRRSMTLRPSTQSHPPPHPRSAAPPPLRRKIRLRSLANDAARTGPPLRRSLVFLRQFGSRGRMVDGGSLIRRGWGSR